jgi:predicted acylesterase/phospholipase RssA
MESVNPHDTPRQAPFCDLVMKGGVTSGVVYPPVILQLAQTYNFRNIGGTSAGAIAACAAAAAELGRKRRNDGSRELQKLEDMRRTLQRPGFLPALFHPSWWTAPLLYPLLDFLTGWKLPTVLRSFAYRFRRQDAAAQPDAAHDRFSGGIFTPRQPRRRGPWWFSAIVRLVLFAPRLTLSFLLHNPLFIITFLVALILGIGRRAEFSGVASIAINGFLMPWLWAIGVCLAYTLVAAVVLATNRRNFFGICSGMPNGRRRSPALTSWMSDQLDGLAGLWSSDSPANDSVQGRVPLTFEHLAPTDEEDTVENWQIKLQMMVTDLSTVQPYLVPFQVKGFLFREDQMRHFFPEYVVQYLIEQGSETFEALHNGDTIVLSARQYNQANPTQRYFWLPEGKQLPVIVGMRMSLSFPVLFQAVPLWTARLAALNEGSAGSVVEIEDKQLQQHLFSDGGIASNFPVHFFDAWLPGHPTFAINLAKYPAEASADTDLGRAIENNLSVIQPVQPNRRPGTKRSLPKYSLTANQPDRRPNRPVPVADAIHLPLPMDEIFPPWQEIHSLLGYVGAMFSTMMNYRDNTQAALPGYRERIVNIRLDKEQGGLNLNMPPEIIGEIDRIGDNAGDMLLTRFNFQHHQWVRFRVLMAELEERLKELRDVLEDEEQRALQQSVGASTATVQAVARFKDQKRAVYRRLLTSQVAADYPFLPANDRMSDQEWLQHAIEQLSDLIVVLNQWGDDEAKFFAADPPQPKSVLRVTPNL